MSMLYIIDTKTKIYNSFPSSCPSWYLLVPCRCTSYFKATNDVTCNYEANACSNAFIAVRRRRRRQGFGPSTEGGGRVGAAQSNSMTTCSVLAELGQVRKVGVRIKR